MSDTKVSTELPYNLGKMTPGWLRFVAVGAILFLIGLIGIITQLRQGEVVTGLRDVGSGGGVAWGLYIVFGVYFIGVSFAGITIAALIRLFNLDHLKPISRLAEWLTVVALVLGALAIWADLGQPLRALTNLALYARPQSPFFGTFTLVISGYLFASLVFLYLDGRSDAAKLAKIKSPFQKLYQRIAAGYKDTPAERARHSQVSFVLAIAIILLLLIAHTTLGLIFGLQVGRPGWFSALQGPSFVILAGVSGLGALIALAAVGRQVLDEKERINIQIFQWLGKALLLMSLIYLYLIIAETLTNLYTGHHAERAVTEAIVSGTYAPLFWISMVSLIVPILLLMVQAAQKRWKLSWLVACGLLVNVTAVGKRYLIVVPSQTHGTLLPYGVGSYTPTWVEYAFIIGLFGLGALLFAFMLYLFPLVPLTGSKFKPESLDPEEKPAPEELTSEVEEQEELPVTAETPEAAPGGGA